MPANLTPDYHRADQQYKAAQTREERLAALDEMMATIPKHKGTEKMRADIKKRISKLKNTEEKGSGKRVDPFIIPREGAGRAILAGAPNSGKSALMKALTNAEPEIAPYPFTTLKPAPGMMPFEDIQIQLVDTAPVTPDRVEGYHANLSRAADLILCVIDLAAPDPVGQFHEVAAIFENIKIVFAPDGPRKPEPYGATNKTTLVIVNKYDLDEDDILMDEFRKNCKTDMEIIPVSAEEGTGLEHLKRRTFEKMKLLRIYSKIPGKPADMDSPFVLPVGSTVQEVAATVHKDFTESLKYARIWGSERFDGQMVQRDYIVHDKDIIELHTK